MGVQLNHTIVWCVDKVRSAASWRTFSAARRQRDLDPFR
jgi:hypothetical protein